jgi:hypothetical protein
MTKKSMALMGLADKGIDVDILREVLGLVSQWLMNIEVAIKSNARWETRAGTVAAYPNTCEVSFPWETGARPKKLLMHC